MSPHPEGLSKNSEGLHQYAKSSARDRAGRTRAFGALTLVALILTAIQLAIVLPIVYSFSKSMVEEFCESAPGGRGYSGDKAPEVVSAVCS